MPNNNKPRVLFLNRSYWPDTEATGQLLTALCENLTDDFEVHVLVGKPNATAGVTDWQDLKTRNGVNIHRVNHLTLSKRSMLLKGLNFLSFIAACRRQIGHLPSPDVVVFETDPFLLPFVADRLHRKTGCPMIGYLQDIYPDVAIALKKVSDSRVIRSLRRRMFDVYRRCQRMVVLSSDMKQLLLDDHLAESQVTVIPNWADIESVYPVETNNLFIEKHKLSGKFVVMYSGNLGLTQRLEEFVEAAAMVQDDDEIQFVFVGRGARKQDLEIQARTLKLSNVQFLDYQPLNELAHSLSAASLHLVPLTKELSQCLMPSKLYGILAAGRPYLTNAPAESELHRITIEYEVGLTVPAGSAQRIAEAIKEAKANSSVLSAMGNNGRELAKQKFTLKRSSDAFREVLTAVTSRIQTTLIKGIRA